MKTDQEARYLESHEWARMDGDVATISQGYHSVAAAPAYSLYYLWMLAGEHRVVHMREDPQHRWVQTQT